MVKREDLLKELDSVFAGLAERDDVEQSTCFVFKDGMVMTYNEEIACVMKCSLDIKAAVPARLFLSILRKLTEDELDIDIEDKKKLVIKGRNKRCSIRVTRKLLLPIEENLDVATKWHKLDGNFIDGLNLVQQCATTAKNAVGTATIIHITPEHIEACDGYEAARYEVSTKIKENVSVKREAVKFVVTLNMTHIGITDTWVSFKNQTGLVFSCRRYKETFPEIDEVLKERGKVTILPKGIKETAERAEIFASDKLDEKDNKIFVTLEMGKVIVTGKGDRGIYKEAKKASYKGDTIKFKIHPAQLSQIVERFDSCEVTKRLIKVTGENFVYVSALHLVKKKKK